MSDSTVAATGPQPAFGAAGDGTPIDLSQIPIGELGERCGIVVTECTPERVCGTMPVVGNRQPYGLLHGGASAVLAESLGSIHANVLAGPGRIAVGLELSCTHHRSATAGAVTGTSTPLHVGRSVSTFQIAIRDDSGRSTCTARLTCMTRSAQRPAGSATERDPDTSR